MLKIGYNNSNQHCGNKSHLEKPDRLNYVIKELHKKQISQELFLLPESYLPVNKNQCLQLISSVHTDKYINSLIDPRFNIITCRNCQGELSNKSMISFYDFINMQNTCNLCNEKLTFDNILSYVDSDTYVTPYTFDIVLEGISVLKRLIDEIKEKQILYGFGLIRPPGHHCCNKGYGFCIVNNAVIATRYAQKNGFNKVLILDIDFHHGDGTQDLITDKNLIYKQIKNTHLISIHGYGPNIYPGTGSELESSENVLNIPINITVEPKSRLYANDNYYQEIIINKVIPYINNFDPDFIIISLGMDAHKNDSLEGLNITDKTYIMITETLKQYNKPLLFITEGGYNPIVINSVVNKMIDVLL